MVENLYTELEQLGIEVLLDDRDERAGVKFNDADLIGAPFQVVVGDKGLANNAIDIKARRTGTVVKLPPSEVAKWLVDTLADGKV